MDKNTIFGFVLIALILVGFSVLNRPDEKELAKVKHYNDSIQQIEVNKTIEEEKLKKQQTAIITDSTQLLSGDSSALKDAFGAFDVAAAGQETNTILENELVKLSISNKGGRIVSAELKTFKTHDSLPLVLFSGNESNMGFTIVTNNNRVVNTSNLFFEQAGTISKDKAGNQTLTMRLKTSTNAFLDYVYTLPANDYMLAFSVKANAMNTVMPSNTNSLEMQWAAKIRQQEKGRTFEDRYSQIHYKFAADAVETMSQTSDEEKKLPNKVKWVAYSSQFFSSIMIAEDAFTSTVLKSNLETEESGYLKSYAGDMVVGFDPTGKTPTNFKLFFGPNQYKVLSSYDKQLEGETNYHYVASFHWDGEFLVGLTAF